MNDFICLTILLLVSIYGKYYFRFIYTYAIQRCKVKFFREVIL